MSDYESLINKIEELETINEKELAEAFRKGVGFAIKTLREVPELKDWSHSRDLKLAPVELSDYVLNEYKKLIE